MIQVALLFCLYFPDVDSILADERSSSPPNIVLIISDDQSSSDFGFMGNASVHTPHLDALAKRSAFFPNGYVPSSVCRPSLVSILTGLYPWQHGVHFNHGPPGNSGYNKMTSVENYHATREKEFELIKKCQTLPDMLAQNRDYRCLQTGKFWEGHWRNGGFTEGMTTFEPPPLSQTYGGIRILASGDRVAHGNGDAGLKIGRETMEPIYRFIKNCEKLASPWLVWYAPYLPHQPHDSPEKYYRLAREKKGVEPHQVPYYASIAQFDDTVGELIEFVEKNSDAANTLFVFVVDNGWQPSSKRARNRPVEFSHTRKSKRAPFDTGVRSPILIRWDKEIQPAKSPLLVSSIDLMPTLLSAAGIERPDSLPGLDLLPIARKEIEADMDRAVYGDIYPGDATSLSNPSADVAYRWIRQGDYKLIVPHGENPWGGYLKSPALYNLKNDPFESTNLAGQKPRVFQRLKEQLDDWWQPSSFLEIR